MIDLNKSAINAFLLYNLPTIFFITPTYNRTAQLADLTRLSHTLKLVPKVHWILVEDALKTTEKVDIFLRRIDFEYTHLCHKQTKEFNGRGWALRNHALEWLRTKYKNENKYSAVVYFGDDDNSYDLRLFNDYIRNVETIGIWAVGLVGGALVEAPKVKNGNVIGWDVLYAPYRKFATDMAGFAVNLRLILATNAIFGTFCKGKAAPETCFLEQFPIRKEQLQVFGFDQDRKEILVWHTRTGNSGKSGNAHGFVV